MEVILTCRQGLAAARALRAPRLAKGRGTALFSFVLGHCPPTETEKTHGSLRLYTNKATFSVFSPMGKNVTQIQLRLPLDVDAMLYGIQRKKNHRSHQPLRSQNLYIRSGVICNK